MPLLQKIFDSCAYILNDNILKISVLKYIIGVFAVVCVIEILSTSCTKETDYLTDVSVLEFSTDTLKFDTVFTTIGSTVRGVKVYNKGNQQQINSQYAKLEKIFASHVSNKGVISKIYEKCVELNIKQNQSSFLKNGKNI